MKRPQFPQKLVYGRFYGTKKFYVHVIVAVNLSKTNLLKNAKKTCKPNNRDLNRDWINEFFKPTQKKHGNTVKKSTYLNEKYFRLNPLSIHFIYICLKTLHKFFFAIFTLNFKQKAKILWEKIFGVNDSKVI